jgi:nucleoside-diphosphate-sugar epimerase
VEYFKSHKGIVLIGHSRKQNLHVQYLSEYTAKALNEHQIKTVIHLAGIAHDLSNQFKPEDYYRVNFEETKVLVDEVLKSNVEKFIYVSSIKALCDTSSTLAEEGKIPDPVTDYGKSKRKAEEYIRAKAWGIKSFYILRPAMIHGQGNKGNLNLLYQFVKSGMPFPFGAFHNQRSFHSIDNFCFVVQSLMEKEIESGTYHLADDGFLSTVELYQLISEVLNRRPRVLKFPKIVIELLASMVGKKAMVSKLTEDMMISNKKITNALGSKLPVSLTEGLTKTIYSFNGK